MAIAGQHGYKLIKTCISLNGFIQIELVNMKSKLQSELFVT